MRRSNFANIILTIELGVCLGAALLLRAFLPGTIFPRLDLPQMVLLSAIALTAEQYRRGCAEKRLINMIFSAILAGLAFSLLPRCTGALMGQSLLRRFLIGGGAFLGTAICYRAMESKLSGRAAPAIQGWMLFLAAQCMQGLG